jgi:hypothetical protein
LKLYRTSEGTFRHTTELDVINMLQVDFLAYSYLYYQCDISLIPDSLYDNICKWLLLHKENSPDAFIKSRYYDLCKGLDESGSGFYLREEDYPIEIKKVCIRLLQQHGKEIPDSLKGLL